MVVGLSRFEPGKQRRDLTKIQYVSSGCFSGIATRLVIQPLDVVKIRFQMQEEPLYGTNRGKYSGRMLKTMRMIWNEEGFKALWRGHIPGQALSISYGIIQYSTFEALSSELFKLGFGKYKMTADFLCGSIAGSLATACSMPFDVIRTRMVVSQGYRNLLHPINKTWAKEGIGGFFHGLTPSLAQIALNAGIKFTAYNWINSMSHTRFYSSKEGESQQIPFIKQLNRLLSGALAGIMAKTITYPLDLVRHRLQINERIRPGAFGQTTTYGGMVATIRGIIQHEGFTSLYKGIWPALIKESTQTALSFFFYELACDLLSGTFFNSKLL
ncbi:hypothetical protein Mgra_00004038 [Meloidogyne graminicola]|uniref:Mitochondrial carrier protein n=1 Tax=Meloidogyne graminicola TaxID=189291 RepID=A0A8S9ZTY3_9BILA|nr:hypothetical protein Mgra_00004038 [Meloidogyne graminicola]